MDLITNNVDTVRKLFVEGRVSADKTKLEEALSLIDNYIKEPFKELMILAGQILDVLSIIEKNLDKNINYLDRGMYVGNEIIKLDNKCIDGHILYIIHATKYGIMLDSLTFMSRLINKLEKSFNYIIEKDPTIYQGMGYTSMGKIHSVVPFFLGGDKKRAIEYFDKSIEMHPHYPIAYVYLSEIYIKDDKFDQANELLEKLMNLETFEELPILTEKMKERGKELLNRIY